MPTENSIARLVMGGASHIDDSSDNKRHCREPNPEDENESLKSLRCDELAEHQRGDRELTEVVNGLCQVLAPLHDVDDNTLPDGRQTPLRPATELIPRLIQPSRLNEAVDFRFAGITCFLLSLLPLTLTLSRRELPCARSARVLHANENGSHDPSE